MSAQLPEEWSLKELQSLLKKANKIPSQSLPEPDWYLNLMGKGPGQNPKKDKSPAHKRAEILGITLPSINLLKGSHGLLSCRSHATNSDLRTSFIRRVIKIWRAEGRPSNNFEIGTETGTDRVQSPEQNSLEIEISAQEKKLQEIREGREKDKVEFNKAMEQWGDKEGRVREILTPLYRVRNNGSA